MGIRVQVVLDEKEKALFRRHAAAEGLSLSAWLKEAALDRISRSEQKEKLQSIEQLQSFFTECDNREAGREPDWDEHLEVIRRSRSSGFSET